MRHGEEATRPDGQTARPGTTRFTMQEPALAGLPRLINTPCWLCGNPIKEGETYYVATVETGRPYPASALVHADHVEPAAADPLAPTIIGEVWQAYSSLSDAQECLAAENIVPVGNTNRTIHLDGCMAAADDRINHAKRHLQGFLEWAEQNHQDAFVRAVTTIACTLEADQHHEEEEAPET